MRSGTWRALLSSAFVVVLTSGCGFMNALADPEAAERATSSAAPTSVVPAAGTPAPEISRGPATPADVVDVGIFADSSDLSETYCDDAPPLPTRDKFWNQMGAATVASYVVLDQAVTPAFPTGRAEVFPTLQLRISDFRQFADPTQVRSLGVGDLTVGAVCADDAAAICVPLG